MAFLKIQELLTYIKLILDELVQIRVMMQEDRESKSDESGDTRELLKG